MQNIQVTNTGIAVLVLLAVCFLVGFRRGLVKELLSLIGVAVVLAAVWFAQPYVSSFLKENTPVYERLYESCTAFASGLGEEMGNAAMSSLDQAAVLQSSSIPRIFRSWLIEHNNAQTYRSLGVSSFADYVAAFFAERIFRAITVLLTWLLASVLVKGLAVLLGTIAHLPGIRTVNRLGGGLLGCAKGLVLLWIILMVLTVFCRTDWGRQGLNLVQQDTLLAWFYEKTNFIQV